MDAAKHSRVEGPADPREPSARATWPLRYAISWISLGKMRSDRKDAMQLRRSDSGIRMDGAMFSFSNGMTDRACT